MVRYTLFSTQFRSNFKTRKNSRPRTNDETILADKTDWVGTPNGRTSFYFNITSDISSAAIAANSVHKDYLRVTPLTTDTTPLNYSTMFIDKTINNSLN